MDPKLLEGGDKLLAEDPDTGKKFEVDRGEVDRTLLEYQELIGLYFDIQSGFLSIPLRDYLTLPVGFIDVFRLFATERAAKEKQDAEKARRAIKT